MAKIPQRVRKAVLPAAGLGTRFLPATKAQPKEMLTVVDKPLIQYVVEECVASGIDNIIVVTGRGKNAIEDHFEIDCARNRGIELRQRFAHPVHGFDDVGARLPIQDHEHGGLAVG